MIEKARKNFAPLMAGCGATALSWFAGGVVNTVQTAQAKMILEQPRHVDGPPQPQPVGQWFAVIRPAAPMSMRVFRLDAKPPAQISLFPGAIEKEFSDLVVVWRRETGRLSSVTKKLRHPAYRRIIDMGDTVVSHILRELQSRPALWFFALEEITKQSPIDTSKVADVATATSAWLEWGHRTGYLTR